MDLKRIPVDKALLVLAGAFYLFFVLGSSLVYRAFDAAYFSFLCGGVVLAGKLNQGVLNTNYSCTFTCLKLSFLLANVLLLTGFFILLVDLPENSPEKQLKPLLMACLLICFSVMTASMVSKRPGSRYTYQPRKVERKNSKNYSEELEAAEAFAEAEAERDLAVSQIQKKKQFSCRLCCNNCCLGYLAFLVGLCSVFIMFTFSWDHDRAPENTFLAQGSEAEFMIPIFEGAETKMAVRCRGIDVKAQDANRTLPSVVYFHGYSGQGLDFAWGYEKLAEDTLICLLDRVGAGFSRNFGDIDLEDRTSEVFATEYLYVFSQMELLLQGLFDVDNLLFVGHSMAGLNMRAVEALRPNIVKGMVMVDPVFAETFDLCDPDKEYRASIVQYIGERIMATGYGLFMRPLSLYDLFAPILDLPSNRITTYISGIMRAEYYSTAVSESKQWGKDCSFVLTNAELYQFPLTVIIPENGLYVDEPETGPLIAGLAVNGTLVLVDDADHTEMVFQEKYADIIIDETRKMISELL